MATTKTITDVDRAALHWLLITGLLACAPLLLELPVWTVGIFIVAAAWRYATERFQIYRPGRWALYALLALVVFAIYQRFGNLFGRDPGVALLVALLGLKLLEVRNRRDAVFSLFLYYIVIAGVFMFEQSMLLAVWAIVTVLTSAIALIRLQQSVPMRPAARLAGELVLKALPLMVILYLLFPRAGGPFWSLPSDAYQGLTGISDTLRPGSLNTLTESSEVAFRVDFLDGTPPPAARDLYWRGIVLWSTSGQSWIRGTPSILPSHAEGPTNAVRYRVTLEPSNKRWMFALDVPVTVAENSTERPGFTFESNEVVLKRTSYTLTSALRYTTGPLGKVELGAALQLPTRSARVRAFGDQLREQYPDPAARVQALLRHIRQENFVYTLAPPLLGRDPVDEFFFDVRRGFCEHYASAFATIMRAARVPARVVMGYQGGELNPNGNYLIVRQSDAHAWVEVWLEERGWTRVDPTAAIAPERIEFGIDAIRRLEAQGLSPGIGSDLLTHALELPFLDRAVRELRLFWDYTNIAWYRWVIDYRRDAQEGLLHGLGFEDIDWTRILWLLGGACAAVMLTYIAWSRRGPPLDPPLRLYLRFCRKLARTGVRRATHEGALDFAARARRARPDLAQAINAITEKYLDLRYGRDASNEDLRAFAHAVARFRARR